MACVGKNGLKNHPAGSSFAARINSDESPGAAAEVREEIPTFYFCPIKPIMAANDTSGGLAAMAVILNYWNTPKSEEELLSKHPKKGDGYSILRLKRIAMEEGLMAFVMSMKNQPLLQMDEQLENGRPVIVALKNESGKFYGEKFSDIEPLRTPDFRPLPDSSLGDERFVVIFGQSEKQFLILDPNFGVVSVDKPIFDELWKQQNYSALICSSF